MEFPQYRKSIDNKSFYKITSQTTFEEIQCIGKRYFMYFIQTKKYFEQLRIKNMLYLDMEIFQNSDEGEFEIQFEKAKNYIANKNKI